MGNMTFVEFRDLLNKHIEEMFENSEYLFTVDADKDTMWETYLNAFPSGTNPIYRKQTIHDCSCCRHFIKSFGNVVMVKDGMVASIWDFECNDDTYDIVRQAMCSLIHSKKISNVYISTEKKISTKVNYEQTENGNVIDYNHFYADIPRNFMAVNNLAKNENLNTFRTGKEVLLRALNEISMDSVDTVLDLIDSNTLYKGPEYKKMVQEFKKLKAEFVTINSPMVQDIFAWEMSTKLGNVVSRIRNHAIGTLLVDISNGVDIEEAVKKYETITAPSNYKRSKPIFTKKMLEDARKTIEDLGYSKSLPRRFATLSDITVNDILFVNRNDAKKMKDGDSIFDQLSKMASSPKEVKPQKFDGVEEIDADTFVSDILPTAEEVCHSITRVKNIIGDE